MNYWKEENWVERTEKCKTKTKNHSIYNYIKNTKFKVYGMPTWNPPNPSPTGGYGLDLMNMNYSPAMYNYFNQGYTANGATQQQQNPAVSAYHQQMLSAQQQMNSFG